MTELQVNIEIIQTKILKFLTLKNGKSAEFIQIWFTLLGMPPVMSPNVKIAENNLTQAIEALRKTVEKGELEIVWSTPGKFQDNPTYPTLPQILLYPLTLFIRFYILDSIYIYRNVINKLLLLLFNIILLYYLLFYYNIIVRLLG